MTRSSDITSFTEFRAHLRDHLDQRKVIQRPLFVTTNGETQAVVLSPAAFDELMDQVELAQRLAVLDRSMEDVKAGRGQLLTDSVREIAGELGLTLDR